MTSQILVFQTFPAVFVISLACTFHELFAFIVSATVYVLLVVIGFVVSRDPCIFFVMWFSVPTLTIYTLCSLIIASSDFGVSFACQVFCDTVSEWLRRWT